jgi:hypothetical protein
MEAQAFSDSQIYKARHALGLYRSKVAYRNRYVAPDDQDWNNLVERGFAEKGQSPFYKDHVYRLSKQAASFFLDEGERFHEHMRFPIIGPYPECKIKGYEGP